MSGAAHAIWQRNPVIAWREIENEIVIISPSESTMHELNDTGSFLWRNIDGRRTAEELADALVSSFEVTRSVALADTITLLEQLSSLKLLLPGDGATPGAQR